MSVDNNVDRPVSEQQGKLPLQDDTLSGGKVAKLCSKCIGNSQPSSPKQVVVQDIKNTPPEVQATSNKLNIVIIALMVLFFPIGIPIAIAMCIYHDHMTPKPQVNAAPAANSAEIVGADNEFKEISTTMSEFQSTIRDEGSFSDKLLKADFHRSYEAASKQLRDIFDIDQGTVEQLVELEHMTGLESDAASEKLITFIQSYCNDKSELLKLCLSQAFGTFIKNQISVPILSTGKFIGTGTGNAPAKLTYNLETKEISYSVSYDLTEPSFDKASGFELIGKVKVEVSITAKGDIIINATRENLDTTDNVEKDIANLQQQPLAEEENAPREGSMGGSSLVRSASSETPPAVDDVESTLARCGEFIKEQEKVAAERGMIG
ncbi:MAG: hypothetical protein KAR79_01560 [Simkaniaceae bacterium]|nr:hypothetical protein [Simkaniaceae bacterium]